jgi:hypothetical protein
MDLNIKNAGLKYGIIARSIACFTPGGKALALWKGKCHTCVIGRACYDRFGILRNMRLRGKDTYDRLHIGSMDDFATLSPGGNEAVVSGLNQERFAYFCAHFANAYKIVQFLHCNLIRDFMPLAQLGRVQYITINWVQKAASLWDMSANASLLGLCLEDINKLTSLDGIESAPKLRELSVLQNVDAKLYLDTLEPLSECPCLEKISIRIEGIRDGSAWPITRMKALKKAGFSATLLETEQFAMLAARLKDVELQFREPYIIFDNKDRKNVLVVGKGKPWLTQGSPKLKLYEAEWNAFIEKYSGH